MSGRTRRSVVGLLLAWGVGSPLAGAVVGLAVAFFQVGSIESPTIVISALFGLVVGFTAMLSSTFLVPRLQQLAPPLRVGILTLALLAIAVVGTLVVLQVYPLFVVREPRQTLAILAINALLALIVGLIVHGYESLRLRLEASLREVEQVRLRAAHLSEEAARAELAALQARINPHFLFNTLNTVASLLDEDPEQAEEVLHGLAGLFRYTFDAADAEPVPLRRELDFVRGYLDVERARFGERLRVRIDVADDALDVPVPGLLLQPIVENAVGHGVAPRREGGTVCVTGRLVGDALHLEVADDGVGLPAGLDPAGNGHGLGNVTRRLAVCYGAAAVLELAAGPGGHGTTVRLTLPRAWSRP